MSSSRSSRSSSCVSRCDCTATLRFKDRIVSQTDALRFCAIEAHGMTLVAFYPSLAACKTASFRASLDFLDWFVHGHVCKSSSNLGCGNL